MVARIEGPQVTFAAGIPISAPVTTALPFNDGIVTGVEIFVPPGPSGLMGFFLACGPQQIIPYKAGQFIVTDNEVIHWPLEGFPTAGAWRCVGYNTDVFAHTIQFRFLINEFAPLVVPSLFTIPVA